MTTPTYVQTRAQAHRRPGVRGLVLAAGLLAVAASVVNLIAIFPSYNPGTTLHDDFAVIVYNSVYVVVPLCAGLVLLVVENPRGATAAALVLASAAAGYLGLIVADWIEVARYWDASTGFWIAALGYALLFAAGIVGATVAARLGQLRVSRSFATEEPGALLAAGLLVFVYLAGLGLPVATVSGNSEVSEVLGGVVDLNLESAIGYGIAALVLVVAVGTLGFLVPMRRGAFVLLGVLSANVGTILGVSTWGNEPALNTVLAPGAGTIAQYTAVVGLLALAIFAVLRPETPGGNQPEEHPNEQPSPALDKGWPAPQPLAPAGAPRPVVAPEAPLAPTPPVTPAQPPPPRRGEEPREGSPPPDKEPVSEAENRGVRGALETLAELHADGLISDAEYKRKRSEVLRRL